MAQRTKNHLIEDESRMFFKQSLPIEWVCRDKPNDYGIDCEVEIFDKKGNSTGLVFWIQLKGTDQQTSEQIKKVSFKIEKIKQFLSYDIPVLIVRYSSKQKIQYYKWAKKISPKNDGKQSIAVQFFETEKWESDSSPTTVWRTLDNQRSIIRKGLDLPIKTYVGRAPNDLAENIPYRNIAAIKQCLSKYNQYFDLTSDVDSSFLQFDVETEGVTASLTDLALSRFGVNFQDLTSTYYSDFSKYILVAVCQLLYDLDRNSLAEDLISQYELLSVITSSKNYLISLLPKLLNGRLSTLVIDVLSEYSKESLDDNLVAIAVQTILFSSRTKHNMEKSSMLEKFLHVQLEVAKKRGSNHAIASSLYNLGNFYRNTQQLTNSIYYFLQARKYSKSYSSQAYYYYELAGVLFQLEKYWFASKFYARSIEMKTDYPLAKALQAHSLIFLGQYELGINLLNEFLIEQKHNENIDVSDWQLWYTCLATFIEHGYPSFQIRNGEAARDSFLKGDLEGAIQNDLLYEVAWFNSAVQKANANDPVSAFLAFTFAALITPNDIVAWTNATLCALSANVELLLLIYIISSAYLHNGHNYLNHLYQIIQEKDPENFSFITELVEKITPEKRKEPVIARIFNEEGNYTTVDL